MTDHLSHVHHCRCPLVLVVQPVRMACQQTIIAMLTSKHLLAVRQLADHLHSRIRVLYMSPPSDECIAAVQHPPLRLQQPRQHPPRHPLQPLLLPPPQVATPLPRAPLQALLAEQPQALRYADILAIPAKLLGLLAAMCRPDVNVVDGTLTCSKACMKACGVCRLLSNMLLCRVRHRPPVAEALPPLVCAPIIYVCQNSSPYMGSLCISENQHHISTAHFN